VTTLYVLRHVKSSWVDAALDDHDRPLSPRGTRAGAALRRHLEKADVRPALVLCSTATRTRATLDLVLPALGGPEVVLRRDLYAASADALLEALRVAPADSVLLVGHNPGLQDLVLELARPGPLRDRVAEKLPTGGLATLDVDAFEPGGATLVDVVVPRDLR
jgi:phosphohistidine phosphatase